MLKLILDFNSILFQPVPGLMLIMRHTAGLAIGSRRCGASWENAEGGMLKAEVASEGLNSFSFSV
jgi:hypothetical protein